MISPSGTISSFNFSTEPMLNPLFSKIILAVSKLTPVISGTNFSSSPALRITATVEPFLTTSPTSGTDLITVSTGLSEGSVP